MNLYEIDTDMAQIVAEIIELEGEVTAELEARIALNEENFTAKAEGYLHAMANAKAHAAALSAEIGRLAARKKSSENLHDRLSSALADSMMSRGIEKASIGSFALSFRRSEAVCVDENLFDFDERFTRVKKEADKTAIKAALKEGAVVPGCTISSKMSLQVK